MPLGLRDERKACYKRSANHLSQNRETNPAPNLPQTPLAPWGAYALTHRDKLCGVNIIKVSALCGKLPIDIIKGFPRNITKHTKRNMLRHSTNPCGKPSFSSPPWGGRGVNTIKSFRSSERLPLKSPCIPVALAFAQARANKCRCKIIKGGRGAYSLTLSTPGEPLK